MAVVFPFDLLRTSNSVHATSDCRAAASPAGPKARQANLGLLLFACVALAVVAAACTGSRLAGANNGWSPAAARDEVVYVGTKQGEVKALEDGGFNEIRVKWTYCVKGPSRPGDKCDTGLGGVYDAPVVGAELVYVAGADGYLHAIDKETGTAGGKGWRVAVGDRQEPKPLIAGPALDVERNRVLVGSEDGSLYAFDARPGDTISRNPDGTPTGRLAWSFPTGDKIWSTPVIRDGKVYFGSHDENVYAVDLETGQELWRFSTGGVVAGRPLLFQNLVVAGSFDKKLYGIDASSGTLVWQLEGGNWFWAGAVTDGKTIFAPSMDGNIYAVDGTGNLLWKHDMGSQIVSRPVLVSGGLVVAAKDGKVSLLNINPAVADTARETSFKKVRDTEIKAPLFADEDAVFVGAQDSTVTRLNGLTQGEVWCFDTDIPGGAVEFRDIECD